MIGHLIYRCRRRGCLDQSRTVPDLQDTLLGIMTDGEFKQESGRIDRLVSLHFCSPGDAGIMDLIGGSEGRVEGGGEG